MSTNNLTVLILAAGYGRRMGPFSRMVNKGLIPYDNKPLISHIIDKFDPETKFVIACGHMGQQIKDYVGSVHKEKNIVFVDIPDYSEANTGPATTIQHCAEHIQNGFLWLACDTLFDFDYKSRLDHNWIGVYPVDSTISQDYCWVERDGDKIVRIENKVASKRAVDAFIGLMYCKDNQYLENLQKVQARETYQGFLSNLDLKAHTVRDWLDFGTFEKWQELNLELDELSFIKPDELFYLDNNKVIKYFSNAESVKSRHNRAVYNSDCMPTSIESRGNFLVHDYAKGDIVYNQLTPDIFKKMLEWCEIKLWSKVVNTANNYNFCYEFYHNKTFQRLNQFRTKYPNWEEPYFVNNVLVKSLDQYLEQIDWNWLSRTIEWRFIHGDLHFDNTIYDPQTGKFTAIDWRTDFAGSVYGDLYYDLAKMLGGIILNYKRVKKDEFKFNESNNRAVIEVPSVENASVYENILKDWAESQKLSWLKVKTLVPVIYLNMSPLHESPFDKFLIALSQQEFLKI